MDPKTAKQVRKGRAEARRTKTAFICAECREADRTRQTHPGQMHRPGLCDCVCLDPS